MKSDRCEDRCRIEELDVNITLPYIALYYCENSTRSTAPCSWRVLHFVYRIDYIKRNANMSLAANGKKEASRHETGRKTDFSD